MASMESQVVVITGAAGGLGSALARSFAREGCQLFLTDQNEARLHSLIDALKKDGATASGETADLSKPLQVRDVIRNAMRVYKRIDTLVNNAGVSKATSFWALTEEDWDSVLDVNVKALFFALQAAAKDMLGRGGSIINIASVAGRLPRPTLMHYAASKAAVISITRSAAMALADSNIRVNAIAPGMIDTEMLQSLRADLETSSKGSTSGQPNVSGIPLGRIAQPEEIAAAALFLASDAASYITGQTLNVCGGICMS